MDEALTARGLAREGGERSWWVPEKAMATAGPGKEGDSGICLRGRPCGRGGGAESWPPRGRGEKRVGSPRLQGCPSALGPGRLLRVGSSFWVAVIEVPEEFEGDGLGNKGVHFAGLSCTSLFIL